MSAESPSTPADPQPVFGATCAVVCLGCGTTAFRDPDRAERTAEWCRTFGHGAARVEPLGGST
ncbi:MAG: hypothetical protein ABEJ79_00340 [Halolamina sp.]